MFLASLAWYRGLAAGGTARIGQLNLAQTFLAVGWSVLLLGEHITWAVPVTAVIVLCCMAVCLRSMPRQRTCARRRRRPTSRGVRVLAQHRASVSGGIAADRLGLGPVSRLGPGQVGPDSSADRATAS
jgi:hypothetical protein